MNEILEAIVAETSNEHSTINIKIWQLTVANKTDI